MTNAKDILQAECKRQGFTLANDSARIEKLARVLNVANGDADKLETVRVITDHLKRGNLKLPASTIVFNLSSAHDCVALANGTCQLGNPCRDCYAYRDEITYPDTLPYRRRQEILFDNVGANEIANAILGMVDRSRTTIDSVRVDESGECKSQEQLERIESAARIVNDTLRASGRRPLKWYMYSAMSWDFTVCDEITVNRSGGRTGPDDSCNGYIAADEIPDGAIVCKCDCRKYSLCSRSHGHDVYVKRH